MFKINNRFYYLVIAISSVLVVYMTCINILYPYLGAMAKENSKGQFEITLMEPKGWAEKAGLEPGDIITEINDKDPQEHDPLVKFGALEKINSLKVIKGSKEYKYSVSDEIINYQSFFLNVIPNTLFLLCVFCSFFIYNSNKRLKLTSAHILNLFLLTISLAYISAGGSSRGDLNSRYINLLMFLSVPVLYMHFIYQYFMELGKKLYSIYFVYFGYMLVIFNVCFEFMRMASEQYNSTYNIAKSLNLCSFLILFILTFLLKLFGLKRVRYSEQEYLVKVIITTNIVAFAPFLLLYALPYVIFRVQIFPPTVLTAFVLLIPFSLVYQFLATKIYDIEFILGRIRYYALLAILPTFALVCIAILLKDSNMKFYSIRLSILFYITLLLVFYGKEIFDFRFRLKRFSEKYNYQDSIFKYTQSIRKASNLDQVVSELKLVIVDVLLVSKAYFIEVNREKHLTSIDLHAKESDYSPYIKEVKDVSYEIGNIIEVDRGFVINIGETEGKNYILLCLSTLNTPRLTRDEISWLKTLSFYTNVSLENFLKIDELMQHLQKVETEGQNPAWLTKLLFSIEEKQRSNLAKDLHDSVLQDLVSLKRQCELALSEVDVESTDLINKLHDMNTNMTKIIKTTRETCQELRPQLLYDLGLVKALNKLVMQYEEIVDFDIRLNTGNFTLNLDIDTQLNLYRIVQELLTNANKHSKASHVLIILVCIKEKIVLHYEDNGLGFEYNHMYDKTESMGLSGISERVKALKGSINIETSKGNGLKIDVEI
ncbi:MULTISPECIES: histidine kinase [Metabacillus]|uniref:histidine kinase n=2 Tax=Metabacillus TaxID=2675233 RepID=A0A179SZC8_9BACI|nr:MULTISPECIES: histidine kinase [Metabacillus]OAS87117.1 hypothetical protein A6K24_20680 [Metabacillus litoralis]QNF26864.1 PDZ domain-containing protein [Metabacillus sp. KUDC1714]